MSASPSRSASLALVVWDFDWSLVNENSDTFVIDQLEPTGTLWRACERKLGSFGWTQVMDYALGELFALGMRSENVRSALEAIPVMVGALDAVALARHAGAHQRLLSDANSEYIRIKLDSLRIASDFRVVETNGGSWDSSGRLCITPHHQPPPHGCPNCPPNLCKGRVLARWLSEVESSSPGFRCLYVGDGSGDVCVAMVLRSQDVLLARRAPHDALLAACLRRRKEIRAEIVEWGGERDLQGIELTRGFENFFKGGDALNSGIKRV